MVNMPQRQLEGCQAQVPSCTILKPRSLRQAMGSPDGAAAILRQISKRFLCWCQLG